MAAVSYFYDAFLFSLHVILTSWIDRTCKREINCLVFSTQNEIDDIEIEKMEEARTYYRAAVAAAKENPTEESLATAAEARLRLQALLI